MYFQKLSSEVKLLSGEKQDRQKVIQVLPEHSPAERDSCASKTASQVE